MTRKEIKKLIYLSGSNGSYQVHNNILGSAIICYTPTVKIGNAIVRALRELALQERSNG